MKKGIVLLIVLLSYQQTNAQDPLKFSGVVECEGSVNELYNRALVWFGETFVSSKEVIQTKIIEADKGSIIGKALLSYNSKILSGSANTNGNISFTINISVKDGRYKYELTDFIHKPNGDMSLGLLTTADEYPGKSSFNYPKSWYNRVWIDLKTQSEQEAKILIVSIEKGMKKKFISSEEDW